MQSNMRKALHYAKVDGCKIGIAAACELASGALWNANCELEYLTDDQLAELQKRIAVEMDGILKGCYSDDRDEQVETVERVLAKCKTLKEGRR